MYTLRNVFQVISLAKSDVFSDTKMFVEFLTCLAEIEQEKISLLWHIYYVVV